ncbi:prolyl-tRNA synthetase associated domain-containing protein [Aerococcus suis]
MITEEHLYEQLEELNIPYKIVKHQPVFTTEEADKQIEGHEGVRTKSLFLQNKKKKRFFIVIMDDSKSLDINFFKDYVDESRIKLASPETIEKLIGLTPGIVSVVGLTEAMNDKIEVFYDREMIKEDLLTFHPNTNDKTIFIKTTDIFKFVASMGYDNQIIDLP